MFYKACALYQGSDVLFMDEVASHLDVIDEAVVSQFCNGFLSSGR
jgi:ABC-type transport system involved in cytochrome bd biosynthesis fused ATPase/permease subunit